MFDSNSTHSNLTSGKAFYDESVPEHPRKFPKTTAEPPVVLRKVKSEEALQTPEAKVTMMKDKVNPHGDAMVAGCKQYMTIVPTVK